MLEIKSLKQSYASIEDLNLHITKGAIFALLGPNGAGKSTTIKATLGLIRIEAGDIKRPDLQKIGYLPENPAFYEYLSAFELLDFYAKLLDIPRRKERIADLLEQVQLKDASNKRLSEFSKGMLQRVGIAQSLLNNPDLIILDEPLSGLDPLGRAQVKDIIRKQQQEGTTVLICSHILADMQDICTHAAIMNKGQILEQGKMKKIIGDCKDLQEAFIKIIQG